MLREMKRSDELEKLLLDMGPSTHRLSTEVLPAMKVKCKRLYAEGCDSEAQQVEQLIIQTEQIIKANNTTLNDIERELYALRRKLTRDRDKA